MGLDNGIQIRRKTATKEALIAFDDEMCLKYNYDPSVAYWRKCWNIRDAIIKAFHFKDGESSIIEKEDVPKLISILKPYLNETYWNENDDSIWSYEVMFDVLYTQLMNLEYLKKYLIDNPNVKCEFYDSY